MSVTPQMKEIIKRCRSSVTFFINNFCKIKHPSIGVIPFKLFGYQKNCLKAFRENRFNCFKKCRQSGISTLCGGYALWTAMFFNEKTILVVSKTDEDAKTFLSRNVKFLYDHLPEWMQNIWKIPINNEHQLGFPNGSLIKSLTSAANTLRSHASSLNIIDEAAFIKDMDAMWAGGYSTLQHGGHTIVISCVPKGTYIYTDTGPQLIDNFIDQNQMGGYAIPKYSILGKNKLRTGGFFYNSGISKTVKLTTRYGDMEGAQAHKMWAYKHDAGYGWYNLSELNKNDFLSIQYGMDVWGNNDDIVGFQPTSNVKYPFNPTKITPELAYFFGLYIAEGSVYSSKKSISHKITITCGDDISGILDRLGLSWTNTDGIHWQIFSTNMWQLMTHLGFKHTHTASDKIIPHRLLKCSKPVIASILSGMYDGDGHSRKRRGVVAYTTTSQNLAKQVRVLLNNFGIITVQNIRTKEKANAYIAKRPPGRVKKHNYDTYHIECSDYYSSLFYSEIGFNFSRKQDNHIICSNTPHGDSWDIIPDGHRICREIFDQLPFKSWTLNKKYKLNLNVVLSTKKQHKKNVSKSTLLKLINIAKENGIDVSKYEDYITKNILWAPIENIAYDEKEVFDFSLPDNDDKWAHSVIYDGFIGHQTPQGIGNWYWRTWSDSIEGYNDFNPIEIKWWDMDWALEYTDDVTKRKMRIAPTDGMQKCTTKQMIEKYGPYWSPWLEGEYKGLQSRGEGHLFKQEILAEFLGSGNTVLDSSVVRKIDKDAEEAPEPQIVKDIVPYVHPITGVSEYIDFNGPDKHEGLYIWNTPELPISPVVRGERIITPGTSGHSYVMGVDIATGKNNDFSTIVVLDIDTREQVAEYMGRCLCIPFSRMVDYIGRWYNNALAVVESAGIGEPFIQSLEALAYPNLWKQKRLTKTGVTYGAAGFPTSATGKPALNKDLCDNLSDLPGQGYLIKSKRLAFQFQTYIRKRNIRGYDTQKTEAQEGNYDDLVMACALAFHGAPDTIDRDPLLPLNASNMVAPSMVQMTGVESRDQSIPRIIEGYADARDPGFLMPIQGADSIKDFRTPEEELDLFTRQLGSRVDPGFSVVKKDYFSKIKRR